MPSNSSGVCDTQDPAGAPVSALARLDTVWLHGAGLAGDTWGPITAGVARAVTPDLPGHGRAKLVKPPRVETYADALSHLVPQDAVLIGHSLGGMVALELAARLQDRVMALVLIETVPTVRDRLSGRVSASLASGLFQSIPISWLAWLSGLGQSRETCTELRRQMARMDRVRIAAALEAAACYDGRPRLSQIDVPTLLIVGKQNTATHHGTALMAERIRGARLVKLPGGHMLHTDNPVQLKRSIDGFLCRSLPN
ncbi:alpha/beta hydrolase [uncultured Roseobacter sp.]|uniref:alpha/beta fold hydrolase n=1 Tax=uncultured Roseobacter sp. TaxID=114847 RepID=UPI00260C2A18|nr:alpha/beta hydrolase [uncultured Roseobacter sp.]